MSLLSIESKYSKIGETNNTNTNTNTINNNIVINIDSKSEEVIKKSPSLQRYADNNSD
jgi:hypothetical protein